jgi:hypothetical protein
MSGPWISQHRNKLPDFLVSEELIGQLSDCRTLYEDWCACVSVGSLVCKITILSVFVNLVLQYSGLRTENKFQNFKPRCSREWVWLFRCTETNYFCSGKYYIATIFCSVLNEKLQKWDCYFCQICLYSCLVDLPHLTNQEQLKEFSWNFILRNFTEISQNTPILVTIGQ